MDNARWAASVVGLALVAVTCRSVFLALLLPRAVRSRAAAAVDRAVTAPVQAWARTAPDFDAADRRLAAIGPLVLLAQLAAFSGAFLAGFTLMLWGFVPDLGEASREIASSMLTLGFAATSKPGPSVIDFGAGMAGFGLVTLQIAYLPTIYDAFNRREQAVTLMASRGGSPPWGPEILVRHQFVGLLDDLPRLYNEWERWAADLSESHTNYPVLLRLRSPHVDRFWLLSLVAVMDAAAMHLALCPHAAPSSARLCLRMGFVSLRDIAATMEIPFDPDPRPDTPIELTFGEYAAGVAHVSSSSFPVERSAEQSWADFRGWRVNYETVAYELADRLAAPPTLWSGTRRPFDFPPLLPHRPAHRRPNDPEAASQVHPDFAAALEVTELRPPVQ